MKVAVVTVIAVAVSACGGSGSSGDANQGMDDRGAVTDLTTIDQLKERFNADAGKPRLIVLASPT